MLVLTSKVSESVVVDGNIEIRIVSVSGNRVKLGITAPNSVGIRRSELTVTASACMGADGADQSAEQQHARQSGMSCAR